jgi:hypothetical protein
MRWNMRRKAAIARAGSGLRSGWDEPAMLDKLHPTAKSGTISLNAMKTIQLSAAWFPVFF